jgi:Asp-tRNA(Asn)/Glu-tRNA(Gln) amidotransferase A subunit family amidase
MMAAGLGALDSATAHSPGRPRIGVLRAPVWREASDDARARFDVWADSLDMHDGVELGDIFDDAVACQRLILDANLAGNFGAVLQTKPEALKAMTRERVVAGLAIGAKAVSSALSRVEEQRTRLGQVFEDYDALLTLAAPGEAPLGLSSTGDAVFSVIWTLMGVPAITLPMLVGEDGLPIGIQLIGARGEDAKLLAIAAQIIERA